VRNRLQERRSGGPHIVTPNQVTTEDRAAPTLRQQDRPLPGVFRNRVPVVSNVPHEGTQPPLRVDNRSRDRSHWSTNWRTDHRYDWKDWRKRHRSHFHLGLYYDPFGWSYRPYSIGWRLWPSYYSSRYWINDPYEYRLPYAPPGYRWIRYWDDALLVDTFTGQVVDVIPNFFW
jgi:Ni/Co efflux regulator RcnB